MTYRITLMLKCIVPNVNLCREVFLRITVALTRFAKRSRAELGRSAPLKLVVREADIEG